MSGDMSPLSGVPKNEISQLQKVEPNKEGLESPDAVAAELGEKPATLHPGVSKFLSGAGAALKIGAGAAGGLIGLTGAALVFPLTSLGISVGSWLGQQKSRQLAESSHVEKMTTDGAIAGSLGFLWLALKSGGLMKSGYAELKKTDANPIKKEIKEIKKELAFQQSVARSPKLPSDMREKATQNIESLKQQLATLENRPSSEIKATLLSQNQTLTNETQSKPFSNPDGVNDLIERKKELFIEKEYFTSRLELAQRLPNYPKGALADLNENLQRINTELSEVELALAGQIASRAAAQGVLRGALKLTSASENDLLQRKEVLEFELNNLSLSDDERNAKNDEVSRINAKLSHLLTGKQMNLDLLAQKKMLTEEIQSGALSEEELEYKEAELLQIENKLQHVPLPEIMANLNAKREELSSQKQAINNMLKTPQPQLTSNTLKENLIRINTEIRAIDDKLSYMSPDDSQNEVKVKEISSGVNLVEKIDMEGGAVAVKKTLDLASKQKAFQIDAIGAMSEFMPQANVVAASRKGGEVATSHVEGLKVGQEAINQLNFSSEVTQHTAMAALSFQMWDLHTLNIGIDKDQNLALFDTDLVLFEDNDFVRLGGKLQPPLGHNKLQDLNIEISDAVIDAHVEQLGDAISSQFLGREHGFTKQEVDIIQNLLIDQFADISRLRVYDDVNYGRNDMFAEGSVDNVKKQFLEMVKRKDPIAVEFFEKLKGQIPDSKLELLKNRPGLLHPGKMSIKQMATLLERKNHLQGFASLRKELKDVSIDGLSDHEIDLKKEFILKNIDHLPIRTSEKIALYNDLRNPNVVRAAIKDAQRLVSEDKVTWNTLAKSMYPTMAAMHDTAENNAWNEGKPHVFSEELSWERGNYDQMVLQPLLQERGERMEFLSLVS